MCIHYTLDDVTTFVIAGLVTGGCVDLRQLLSSTSRFHLFVSGQHPCLTSADASSMSICALRNDGILLIS